MRINMKKHNELTIGNTGLFAIIHLCLPITCIFSLWYFFREFIFDTHWFFTSFLLLLFGIAGIGIYIFLVPNLRVMENDYIKLRDSKNDKKI